MLRVKKAKLQVRTSVKSVSAALCPPDPQTQDKMHHLIGKRIKDLWGRVLFETCHMGPEQWRLRR
jgi:hypothetical protein